MSFRIIREKLRVWFREQLIMEDQFIPDFCQLDENCPHALHTSENENKDIVQMLNTVVDLQLLSGRENEQYFEEAFKSLKVLTESLPKDITERSMTDFADKVTRALNRLEQLLKSKIYSEFPRENPVGEIASVLESLLNQVKIQNKHLKDLERNYEEISTALKTVLCTEIKAAINHSSKASERRLCSEFSRLETIVKDLVFELKFDPNNPKPTELRTEENSKQILKLNQDIIPILERCEKTLAMSVGVLKKLEHKLS